MKRDMELVRKILFALEEHDGGYAPDGELTFEGYTSEVIGFHILLMGEAGLLISSERPGYGTNSPVAIPQRLTWAGYEFLEAAKDETAWAKTKAAAASIGGSAFESIKTALISYGIQRIKDKMGLPPG